MNSKAVTINARKFDNRIHRTWQAELVSRKGPLLTFIGEFALDISHPDLGEIKRGTVSYEYYWLDRWYNVFRFENPSGELRNYYCNVNKPPVFSGDTLDYVDLDIDVLIKKDLSHEVLDLDEFLENSVRYGYGPQIEKKAEESLEEILTLFRERKFPFEDAGHSNS